MIMKHVNSLPIRYITFAHKLHLPEKKEECIIVWEDNIMRESDLNIKIKRKIDT